MNRSLFILALFAPAAGSLAAEPPSKQLKLEFRPAAEHRPQWELTFPDQISDEEYARRLEFFAIEIAAVAKDGSVEYVTRLTDKRPARKTGRRDDDPRLYLGWRSGTLADADRRLLAKGGVNPQRKEIVHYFPAELQQRMTRLERAYADRPPAAIARTRFEIRPLDAGYEIVVVEQESASRGRDSVVRGVLNGPHD